MLKASELSHAQTPTSGALSLPHLPPWIFVDRINYVQPPDFIQATKVITEDDSFVRVHFKGKGGIFPGVLLIEMVGQVATLLQNVAAQSGEHSPDLASGEHLLARCKASFRSPARTGDVLTINVNRKETVGSTSIFEGIVKCGDRVVCLAELLGVTTHD